MSISGVKVGQTVYYCRPAIFLGKSFCKSVKVLRVTNSSVEVEDEYGQMDCSFHYPGGGLKGNALREFLSLEPKTPEELGERSDDEEFKLELNDLMFKVQCRCRFPSEEDEIDKLTRSIVDSIPDLEYKPEHSLIVKGLIDYYTKEKTPD